MFDQRIRKMAGVLVNYSLGLEKGDKFMIEGFYVCKPLMLEVYKEALKVGAHPEIHISLEESRESMLLNGTDKQLKYILPSENMIVNDYDALLTIWGGENLKYLSAVDADRIALHRGVRREINEKFMNKIASGEIKWCGTQFPTKADAQEASMSTEEYEEFIFDACMLNCDNPAEEWKKVHDKQQRLIDILDTKKKIRIVSDGTDISMSVDGRKWINCDGKENFPDGEIFTSPIEDTVEGVIRFSYPAIFNGNEVEDVVLRFENGKCIEAKAKKGEEFLNKILDSDEGGRFVGEIAVGTNYSIPKFTKNMLFDEKLGGTVHMALGASLPEAGGKNVSAIHWDMLCDMENGEIYADDKLIYKNSKFII